MADAGNQGGAGQTPTPDEDNRTPIGGELTPGTEPNPKGATGPQGGIDDPSVTGATGATGSTGSNEEESLHGAPEVYEGISFGEGMTVSDEDMAQFTEYAKSLNLSNKGAQKLATALSEYENKKAEAMISAINERNQKWLEESKNDEIIGKANFENAVSIAKLGLLKACNNMEEAKEVQKLFNHSSLGNNVHVIKMLYNIGNMFKEDHSPDGGSLVGDENSKPKTLKDMLYPEKQS